MDDIEITEVSTADVSEIQTIAEIAFPQTYVAILSQEQIDYMMNWMYSTESLIKQMQEGKTFFVARTKTKTVGFISIRPDEKDLYHIEKIYILPNFQKKHIGVLLFAKAKDYAIQANNNKPLRLQLNVNRDNPAVSFYKKLGMHVAETVDKEIGNGFQMNDYIMEIEVK